MATPKEVLITNDPITPWANAVKDKLNESRPMRSGDFLTTSQIGGSHLSLHPKYKYAPNYMAYAGSWNWSDGYSVGDVVRVMPGDTSILFPPFVGGRAGIVAAPKPNAAVQRVYGGRINVNGTEVPYIYGVFVPVPGTYICVANVPPLYFALAQNIQFGGGTSIATGIVSYGVADNWTATNLPYIRFYDVNYVPVWPEMPITASLDRSNLAKARGRYWELLSTLPTTQHVCRNGVNTSIFVDSSTFPSGSDNYTGSLTP